MFFLGKEENELQIDDYKLRVRCYRIRSKYGDKVGTAFPEVISEEEGSGVKPTGMAAVVAPAPTGGVSAPVVVPNAWGSGVKPADVVAEVASSPTGDGPALGVVPSHHAPDQGRVGQPQDGHTPQHAATPYTPPPQQPPPPQQQQTGPTSWKDVLARLLFGCLTNLANKNKRR